jgi:hypothetical protein
VFASDIGRQTKWLHLTVSNEGKSAIRGVQVFITDWSVVDDQCHKVSRKRDHKAPIPLQWANGLVPDMDQRYNLSPQEERRVDLFRVVQGDSRLYFARPSSAACGQPTWLDQGTYEITVECRSEFGSKSSIVLRIKYDGGFALPTVWTEEKTWTDEEDRWKLMKRYISDDEGYTSSSTCSSIGYSVTPTTLNQERLDNIRFFSSDDEPNNPIRDEPGEDENSDKSEL